VEQFLEVVQAADPGLAATVLGTFCVNSDLCHLGKIAGLLRR
jgi:hypothetical protein